MSSIILRRLLISSTGILLGVVALQFFRSYVPEVVFSQNLPEEVEIFGRQIVSNRPVDVSVLRAKPLFSQSRRATVIASVPTSSQVLSKTAAQLKRVRAPVLKLVGVVGAGEERIAVFWGGGSGVRRKRIGQKLGKWLVDDVQPNHVVVKKGGQVKTYRLQRSKPVKGAASVILILD